MGLNWRQFELGVLRPTLEKVDEVMPSSEAAVKLVGETIWHESDQLRALGQYDSLHSKPLDWPFGPGLGIASIEEPTWDWMWTDDKYGYLIRDYDYKNLIGNLPINIIACRLRYFLDRMPLPNLADGIEARATYWWRVYNRGQVDRRPDYIKNARVLPWA